MKKQIPLIIVFLLISIIAIITFIFFNTDRSETPWIDGQWTARTKIDLIVTDPEAYKKDFILIDLDKIDLDGDIKLEDLLISSVDGTTLIPYMITSYAPENISHALLIKNPNEGQKKSIYIYEGKESQQQTLEEKVDINEESTLLPSKYFADNGASSALQLLINPSAVTYKDKTYITYQGTDFDIFLTYFDHQKQIWSEIQYVADSPMENDHHGAPILYIDRAGYIYVFFGCHGKSLEFVKSKSPENIDEWVQMPVVTTEATYPQVFEKSDGSIEIFYRAGTHKKDWISSISSDGGETWAQSTPVIDGDIPLDAWYARFVQDSDHNMHVTFLWKDDANIFKQPTAEYNHRYNIYYLKRDEEGVWRNIEGKEVNSPINKIDADKLAMVYNSEDAMEQTNTASLTIDKSGIPHLIFLSGPYDEAVYKYATWKNKYWVVEDIGIKTNDMFDGNYIVSTENKLQAALIVNSSDGHDRGGDIQTWTYDQDERKWEYQNTILADSGVLIHPPKYIPYIHSDDLLLFADFSMDFGNYNHKLYLMSDDKYIGRSYITEISDRELK